MWQMNKRWLTVLFIVLLVGGLLLRRLASWRPQKVAQFNGATQLQISLSPDGKWLLVEDVTSNTQSPQLIELATGKLRPFEAWRKWPAQPPQWTSRSQLAFGYHSGAAIWEIAFFDPNTLRLSVSFIPKSRADILSWSESKNDMWMITRHQWLHFDARTGQLLQQHTFRACGQKPTLWPENVNISPDGTLARVKDSFWDLKTDKPLILKDFDGLGDVNNFHWVNNECYSFAHGGLIGIHGGIGITWQRAQPELTPNLSIYRTKNMFLRTRNERTIEFYNADTQQLIESVNLPRFPLNWSSLDFSPDREFAYTSKGNEIWRVRLK
ncbi:hypothetical protein IAD21_04058 [Abditibacteriota bacterium]|nr:hypothetical protein IAD21_04058 [Abditibacteriota bacterium]